MSSFQLGPCKTAPAKKDCEKEDHSAIKEVVMQNYTINIHKCTHGVGCKHHRDPGVCHERNGDSRRAQEYQAQQNCLGQRNKEHPILLIVSLSRKRPEDEDSPTSSILWLLMCRSALSKIHSQCGRELNKVLRLPKKKNATWEEWRSSNWSYHWLVLSHREKGGQHSIVGHSGSVFPVTTI